MRQNIKWFQILAILCVAALGLHLSACGDGDAGRTPIGKFDKDKPPVNPGNSKLERAQGNGSLQAFLATNALHHVSQSINIGLRHDNIGPSTNCRWSKGEPQKSGKTLTYEVDWKKCKAGKKSLRGTELFAVNLGANSESDFKTKGKFSSLVSTYDFLDNNQNKKALVLSFKKPGRNETIKAITITNYKLSIDKPASSDNSHISSFKYEATYTMDPEKVGRSKTEMAQSVELEIRGLVIMSRDNPTEAYTVALDRELNIWSRLTVQSLNSSGDPVDSIEQEIELKAKVADDQNFIATSDCGTPLATFDGTLTYEEKDKEKSHPMGEIVVDAKSLTWGPKKRAVNWQKCQAVNVHLENAINAFKDLRPPTSIGRPRPATSGLGRANKAE